MSKQHQDEQYTSTAQQSDAYRLMRDLIDDLLTVETRSSQQAQQADTLLVLAPACSGKTRFAYRTMLEGLRTWPERVVLCVANRQIAARLSNDVIRDLGVSSQSRPVVTLAALAFRCMTLRYLHDARPLPKLLNGAEQDALLRRVVAAHVIHVRRGDNGDCATCSLFEQYFATTSWDLIVSAGNRDELLDGAVSISGDCVHQLRDMLARLDELNIVDATCQERIFALLESDSGALDESVVLRQRRQVQWSLAFALREEYWQEISRVYPAQSRCDASRLLIEGADAVRYLAQYQHMLLPQLVIVDDVHDITLAGLSLLRELHDVGVRLVLTANPDEAVQTFRGSYPDYVLQELCNGVFHTVRTTLAYPTSVPSARERLLARVSLSIASQTVTDQALPSRVWKMPQWNATLPVQPLLSQVCSDPNRQFDSQDGSLSCALYRSAREEVDSVIWQMKRLHLDRGVSWSDMALIAHDNTMVRVFGERLRNDGVPVRYSSLTRPLSQESFVQGLFALIELAQLLNELRHAVNGRGTSLQGAFFESWDSLASYIRVRLACLVESPLAAKPLGDDNEFPLSMRYVEPLLRSIVALYGVVASDQDNQSMPLTGVYNLWIELSKQLQHYVHPVTQDGIEVDNRILNATSHHALADTDTQALSLNACYVLLLAERVADRQNISLMRLLTTMAPDNDHIQGLQCMLDRVERLADQLDGQSLKQPAVYVLSQAWSICNVAERWQRCALHHHVQGRIANNRLDVAMRLFEYASSFTRYDESDYSAGISIREFIEQLRGMEIEADSLAHIAPIDEAVTLTTPAGSVAQHWPHVWVVGVQQRVWPNVAVRSTMFASEVLTDLVLREQMGEHTVNTNYHSRSSVLNAEQRSFFMALSRAQQHLYISAVQTVDTVPSDFLYYYLPEWYDRSLEHTRYTIFPEQFAQLDASERGLVAAARSAIICSLQQSCASHSGESNSDELSDEQMQSNRCHDAVATLRLLAEHGVMAADSDEWDFICDTSESKHDLQKEPSCTPVRLSPSMVDALWACPVCGLLERQCLGPQEGSIHTAFGTSIHEVARWASEEQHWDMPEVIDKAIETILQEQVADSMLAVDAKLPQNTYEHARLIYIQRIVERMRAYYQSLSGQDHVFDVATRYRALSKDRSVCRALNAIAHYFVASAYGSATYAHTVVHASDDRGEDHIVDLVSTDAESRNKILYERVSFGKLERAYCEMPISAHFGFEELTHCYMKTAQMHDLPQLSQDELYDIMGYLVGGWPQGASQDLRVHLQGRIDRVEVHRALYDDQQSDTSQDQKLVVRIIDYKTGKSPSDSELISDLQLVCYQLALAFCDDPQQRMTGIAQSMLFHVVYNDYPAQTHGIADNLTQPCLFINGLLSTTPLIKRKYLTDVYRAYGIAPLCECRPDTLNERAWNALQAWYAHTDESSAPHIVWSLTMIARVMYAAAVTRSSQLIAHPTQRHQQQCSRMRHVCPACNGSVDTVIEIHNGVTQQ